MTGDRALDAWIAEHVMGCKPGWSDGLNDFQCWCDGAPHGRVEIRRYSSDWAAAGELVEKMRARGFYFGMDSEKAGRYSAVFAPWTDTLAKYGFDWGGPEIEDSAFSTTGPMAIALAAKKALEGK